jgi:hypothetical protein
MRAALRVGVMFPKIYLARAISKQVRVTRSSAFGTGKV